MSDPHSRFALEWLPGGYAVCRLASDALVPEWALAAAGDSGVVNLCSVTRTNRELSVVADESRVPAGIKAEHGFVAMRILGVIDFAVVGVVAALTSALAQAGVSVFVISTFDTDVLLVRKRDADKAFHALSRVADLARPPRYD